MLLIPTWDFPASREYELLIIASSFSFVENGREQSLQTNSSTSELYTEILYIIV